MATTDRVRCDHISYVLGCPTCTREQDLAVEAIRRAGFNPAGDEIERLKLQVERLERERDEYQARLHTANERLNGMTSAASSAAATTVTAIERIQKMEKVVEAAIAWHQGGPHAKLSDEVREWLKYKKTWA